MTQEAPGTAEVIIISDDKDNQEAMALQTDTIISNRRKILRTTLNPPPRK